MYSNDDISVSLTEQERSKLNRTRTEISKSKQTPQNVMEGMSPAEIAYSASRDETDFDMQESMNASGIQKLKEKLCK